MKIYNNRYKVISELGQGAYGKIHLAEDLKSKISPIDMEIESHDATTEKYLAIKKMKIDVKKPIIKKSIFRAEQVSISQVSES